MKVFLGEGDMMERELVTCGGARHVDRSATVELGEEKQEHAIGSM